MSRKRFKPDEICWIDKFDYFYSKDDTYSPVDLDEEFKSVTDFGWRSYLATRSANLNRIRKFLTYLGYVRLPSDTKWTGEHYDQIEELFPPGPPSYSRIAELCNIYYRIATDSFRGSLHANKTKDLRWLTVVNIDDFLKRNGLPLDVDTRKKFMLMLERMRELYEEDDWLKVNFMHQIAYGNFQAKRHNEVPKGGGESIIDLPQITLD
jgi:hypothetical protein